jgi:hypothetical protein
VDAAALDPWGEGLDEAAFARALAALGVLLGADPTLKASPIWRLGGRRPEERVAALAAPRRPIRWNLAPVLRKGAQAGETLLAAAPAAELAAAWSAIPDRDDPRRFRIESSWDDFPSYRWVLDQVALAVPRATAYVPARLPSTAPWHWPLRLGFLGDSAADRLRDSVDRGIGFRTLVEPLEVRDRSTPCDLLVVSTAFADPLETLEPFGDDVEVGCIAFIGQEVRSAKVIVRDVVPRLASMEIRAWGVAFIEPGQTSIVAFLNEIIRHVSHDQTFDVAIANATKWLPAPPPILLADPRSLERARLSVFATRLVAALPPIAARPPRPSSPRPVRRPVSRNGGGRRRATPRRASPRGAKAPPRRAPTTGDVVGVPEEFKHFGDLATHVERETLAWAVRTRESYLHESDAAEDLATTSRAMTSRIEAAAPKPRPRRIQAEVYRSTSKGTFPRRTRSALRPQTPHAIDVSIGFGTRRQLTADRLLDVSFLPQDRRSHRLDVVFQEIGSTRKPQTKRLLLPPDDESKPSRFTFTTPDSGIYRARIIVAYRSRVLQSVRFEADVTGPGRRVGTDPLRLTVEASPRATMSDLGHRRSFDLALVANHDERGRRVLAALARNNAKTFSADELDETIDWFERKLTRVNDKPLSRLRSRATVTLLRDFAQKGSEIFYYLGRWEVLKNVAGSDRVQLVPGDPDAFFPIEFVYDKDMPVDDAPLCEGAETALRTGACPATCPPGGDQASVVCPLGFWCLSKVIERHAFVPGAIGTREYSLLAEPATGRDRLSMFKGAAYAASDLVDQGRRGSIERVHSALDAVVNPPIDVDRTWDGWKARLKDGSRSLLVIICHTAEKRSSSGSVVQLEIGASGAEEWLAVNRVKGPYVVGTAKPPPTPVVMLIGCSTAVTKLPFQDPPGRFQYAGASIVLSTMSTILGRHAAAVTAGLINRLAALAAERDRTFGDALLQVRREMLADDVPMVLALAAFGDADWRLTTSGT